MILGIDQSIVELWLLNSLLAYSAYIVLTSGAFSFAYVAFIAVGAYTAGILATKHGGTLVEALIIAPIISGLVALVIARPLERLSGVYLAIVSVSLVGLVQVLLVNLDKLTNGPLGIAGIPLIIHTWELVLGVVLVALIMRQVERSNLGRAIRMTRLDPLVAGAMGVNVRRVRLWLFVASAVVAAIAGVLRGYYLGFIVPTDYGFDLVILLLAMVIIGGVGSWVGPLIGAAIFTLLPQWLQSFGDWRDVITGVLLLIIIIVSREGLASAIALQWHRQRARMARRGSPPVAADGDAAEPARPAASAADDRANALATNRTEAR